MTLKYFFYHQIFFQDSAQTEILTVFSNPKYWAWTFWNTEHEHFEILSMKLNCKYWACMDWNPRNTDVPASVFRRYCDTYDQQKVSIGRLLVFMLKLDNRNAQQPEFQWEILSNIYNSS